jgi:hypothetical protein
MATNQCMKHLKKLKLMLMHMRACNKIMAVCSYDVEARGNEELPCFKTAYESKKYYLPSHTFHHYIFVSCKHNWIVISRVTLVNNISVPVLRNKFAAPHVQRCCWRRYASRLLGSSLFTCSSSSNSLVSYNTCKIMTGSRLVDHQTRFSTARKKEASFLIICSHESHSANHHASLKVTFKKC